MEKVESLKEGDALAGVDKNKLIESANKFIAKNQFDKAIKDLQKVLELEPKNNQAALKIAELFLKLDKKEEATNYYEIASNIFRDSGFYDKAIAVYRQLLTINPVSSQAYLRLAELFRKKNLIAEAVSNYKVAIAIYEREGRTQDALNILQTITELEPSNLPGRMKLAELYIKNGLKDQAYTELSKIAEKLIEAKRTIDIITVYERMLSIKSGDISILKQLIKLYTSRGDYQKILLKVKEIIALGKSDTDVLIALAKTYVALDKIPLAISAYKEVAKLYSKEGLDSQMQDIYKKILELDPTDQQALQVVVGTKAKFRPMQEIVPEPLETTTDRKQEVKTERQQKIITEKQVEKPQAKIPKQEPVKEIVQRPSQKVIVQPDINKKEKLTQEEIEKYFSEAQVYKRYGLNTKAVEKLNQILEVNPSHIRALTELFELYELWKKYKEASSLAESLYNALTAQGEIEKAEDFIKQAIANDPDNEILKAHIGYTPAAKENVSEHVVEEQPLVAKKERPAQRAAGTSIEEKIISEKMPLVEDVHVETMQEQMEKMSSEAHGVSDEIDTGIEIEVESPASQDKKIGEEYETISSEQHADEETSVNEPLQEEPREEIPIPEQINLEPEFEEAKKDVAEVTAKQKQEEDIGFNFSEEAPASVDKETYSKPAEKPESVTHVKTGQQGKDIDIIDSLDEAEFYCQQGILSEAKGILRRILNIAPNDERARKKLADILAKEEKLNPHIESKIPDLDEPFIQKEVGHVIAVSADEDLFDLAQELEKELSGTIGVSQVQQPPEEEQQVSVEEVLEAFKKGVEKSVDKQDVETHYNLGIAYKEMGLIDEAINEFNIAILLPDRKADGLIMLGMSYMGKGLPGKAIEMYKQALEAKGGIKAENIGLLYEFAIAFEAYGDMKNAYNYFDEVGKIDGKFRDVKDKLDKLEEFVRDGLEQEGKPEKLTLDGLLKEDIPEEHDSKSIEKQKTDIIIQTEQGKINNLNEQNQVKEDADIGQNKVKQTKKKVSYI
jgi:tetratricopeptide (TPR) repeat protein